MKKSGARSQAIFVLVNAVFTASAAPQTVVTRPPSVRTSATAVVVVKPDRATIEIGVVTQNPTAQGAASMNAAQVQTVLDKLRAISDKADIRTISYSVSPNYEYPAGGGKPKLVGYTAANAVQVTTSDLPGVGKIIDAASEAGANQIQRLEFGLRDEKPAREEALRKATLEARSNAEAMAGALGLKLGPVISLEQGASGESRPPMPMAARVGAAPTPVEPGGVEVRAAVTLTIALQ